VRIESYETSVPLIMQRVEFFVSHSMLGSSASRNLYTSELTAYTSEMTDYTIEMTAENMCVLTLEKTLTCASLCPTAGPTSRNFSQDLGTFGARR
jgi:lipopolysaccharide biosynthesis protein